MVAKMWSYPKHLVIKKYKLKFVEDMLLRNTPQFSFQILDLKIN